MTSARQKPPCKLIGKDGNIFNLLSLAATALINADQRAEAKEMRERVYSCGSNDEALCIIGEYVVIY